MSRTLDDVYKINGQPMFAPDRGQDVSFEDIDASGSGRLEDGYMYRSPVRYKVGTWTFSYARISEEDKQYMESLFPDSPTFQFTHPDRKDATKLVTTKCYRSKYSATWFSQRDGVWKNYKFNIIEC